MSAHNQNRAPVRISKLFKAAFGHPVTHLKKQAAPFSLRLTSEEKEYLKQQAA